MRPPKGAKPVEAGAARLNLYLMRRLYARLGELAKEMGIRPTDLARMAIANHLDTLVERRGLARVDRLNQESLEQLRMVQQAAANVLDGTPGRRRRVPK